MTSVEIGDNGFIVDAEVIAEAFSIAALEVQSLMQSKAITSRCEKGVNEDEGRWRLTFFHNNRVFRQVRWSCFFGQVCGLAKM